MTTAYAGGPVVAEVERSAFIEGLHHGSAVVLDGTGAVRHQIGDVTAALFPRSSNKPMQATAAVRAGMRLRGADLALACGSHRGEPFHVARVRRILLDCGLTPDALRCPASLPIDEAARDAVLSAGGGPTRLLMNCSGKHAGMLAACVAAGWSTNDYPDPGHPLQKLVKTVLAELSGEPIVATGVDGCGAPLFSLSLTGLARSFQRLVESAPDSAQATVADAVRAHPEQVSGTRGFDTRLMRAVPGLLSKGGAEGVAALAVPGRGAIAVKIDDGNQRATVPVAVAALRALNLDGLDIDERTLDELATTPVLGGGRPVGAVRPLAGLFGA